MAIDSKLKRHAIAAKARGKATAGVTVNAAKPQAWRQAAGRSYPGILAGLPPVVVPGGGGLLLRRRRR